MIALPKYNIASKCFSSYVFNNDIVFRIKINEVNIELEHYVTESMCPSRKGHFDVITFFDMIVNDYKLTYLHEFLTTIERQYVVLHNTNMLKCFFNLSYGNELKSICGSEIIELQDVESDIVYLCTDVENLKMTLQYMHNNNLAVT